MFLLVVCDLGGNIHSLCKKLYQFVIDLIDFTAKFMNIHQIFLLFVCVLPRIKS